MTSLTINGTYDGPTDVVSVTDYQLTWSGEGANIHETGSATLTLRSGQTVRQVWTSTITPRAGLAKLPQAGEALTITVSPLQIAPDSMSYSWQGSVRARQQ